MIQEKDAIMPHGYGWETSSIQERRDLGEIQKGDLIATIYDVSKPSGIGELAVDAAAVIKAKQYVVAGDRLWNHLLTSAETYAHAIRKRSPDASIINAGGARTTSMEVRKLVKEAKEHDWKNVATVAVGPHYERAALVAAKINRKRGIRKKGISIQVFRAEDVLSDPQTHGGGDEGERIAETYKERFARMQATQPYRKLEKHEKKAIYIEKLHLTRVVDLASWVVRPKVMSK
ncbi:MAG TPA: hypothetical protein VLF93_01275 [Candidatus Saccharimonadales bacterium]|nr:hypothetical protein [Candidatus Saccharimonadales bacterium]